MSELDVERERARWQATLAARRDPVNIRRQENLETWWVDVVNHAIYGFYGTAKEFRAWSDPPPTEEAFKDLCRRIEENRQKLLDFRWLPYARYRLEPIPEIGVNWDRIKGELYVWPIWSSVPSLMWDSVDWWHENHPMNCEEWAWMKGEPDYEPSF